MSKDAKAVAKQRLAEALRANLRRRKVARTTRGGHESGAQDTTEAAADGSREAPADDVT